MVHSFTHSQPAQVKKPFKFTQTLSAGNNRFAELLNVGVAETQKQILLQEI
jgi:hypothetical protein